MFNSFSYSEIVTFCWSKSILHKWGPNRFVDNHRIPKWLASELPNATKGSKCFMSDVLGFQWWYGNICKLQSLSAKPSGMWSSGACCSDPRGGAFWQTYFMKSISHKLQNIVFETKILLEVIRSKYLIGCRHRWYANITLWCLYWPLVPMYCIRKGNRWCSITWSWPERKKFLAGRRRRRSERGTMWKDSRL